MNAADYDRFSVVAFASPPVRDKVEELRRLLPPSGRPIIAPHVTIKGTFVDPTDLDEIAAKARAICEAVGPINVTLGDLYQYGNREHGGLGFGVAAPAALVDLHGRLVAAIEPLCTPLDGAAEDPARYHPHLTIVQQLPPDDLPAARAVADVFDIPRSFRLEEGALMGRRRGGQWEALATVGFSG